MVRFLLGGYVVEPLDNNHPYECMNSHSLRSWGLVGRHVSNLGWTVMGYLSHLGVDWDMVM
jgi:hypothetical protein